MKRTLADIALAEVGTREEGGNNLGAKVAEYQRSTWLEPAGWPWCAAFTCWALKRALTTPYGEEYLAKKRESVEGFRCKDASAFGWIKWANRRGLMVFDETSRGLRPEIGDFVVFDFSHIGIVVQDQLPSEKVIHTVEGNTNGRGERDSEQGDGVWRKTRNEALVKAYIRL